MAKISEDTQAIIDALDEQRNNLQNDGRRHSLKNVRKDLAKFQGTFDAIKAAMTGMEAMTTQQTEFDKLRAQEEAEIAKLAKEDQEEFRKQQAENVKKSQAIETEKLKQDEKRQKENQKREFKLFGKDGIVTSAIKNTFSFLKTAALFAALGAVGYEFIAGVLEAAMPGVFGEEGSIGKLPTAFELFDKMGKIFQSTDWESLKTNLNFLASSEFYGALMGIGAAIGTTYVAGKGLQMAGGALTATSLASLLTPDANDVNTAGGARFLALRGAIAGSIFIAAEAMMPIFENAVRLFTTDMNARDIMTVKPTPMGQAPGNLATAGMAALFAPGGPFVKAIVGFATFGILTVMDLIDEAKDEDIYSNAMEEVLRYESAEVNKKQRELNLLQKRAKYLGDGSLEQEIADKEQELHDAKMAEKEAAKKALEESLEKQKDFRSRMEAVESNMVGTLVGPALERFLEGTGKRTARGATDAEKAQYGLTLEEIQSGVVDDIVKKRKADVMYMYTDGSGRGSGRYNIDTVNSQVESFLKRFPEFMSLVDPKNKLRAGTKGFRNFGDGTLALLHGEEAVIPRGSLEGQILEGLRSGMLPTKDNMTGLIAKAMQGSNMGGMTTIVNNVDNSSPISIQQSKGGDKISNSRFMGGGGGGSYVDMPGLVS